MTMLTEHQLIVAVHGGMAVFGALVNTLESAQRGEVKSFKDKFTLFTICTFAGAVFGMLAVHYFPNQPYLTGAISGGGGYLGQEGLKYLVKFAKSRAPKVKETE